MILRNRNDWKFAKTDKFWAEIAPLDHIVQIYENDDVLLKTLEGFVASGIKTGDGIVLIATQKHLELLNFRLAANSIRLSDLEEAGQYFPVTAEELLDKITVHSWPDESLFNSAVRDIIAKGRGESMRRVRVFSELEALLWQEGQNVATIRLEYLWGHICETEAVCVLCGYPEPVFKNDALSSIPHVCSIHTKVIDGSTGSATEVYYHRTSKETSTTKGLNA